MTLNMVWRITVGLWGHWGWQAQPKSICIFVNILCNCDIFYFPPDFPPISGKFSVKTRALHHQQYRCNLSMLFNAHYGTNKWNALTRVCFQWYIIDLKGRYISWAPQLMEGALTYHWDKGSLPTSIFNSLPFTFSAAEMGSPQNWLMTLNRLNQHCSTVSSLCRQCVLILGFDFTQSFFCLFLSPLQWAIVSENYDKLST